MDGLGYQITQGYNAQPVCISENGTLQGKTIIDAVSYDGNVIAKDNEEKLYSWGNNYTVEPTEITEMGELEGKKIVKMDIYRDENKTGIIILDREGNMYIANNGASFVCINNIEEMGLKGKVIEDFKMIKDYYGTTIIARDKAGKVYTMGYNRYGQMGNGTNEDCDVFVCISDMTTLQGKNIVEINTDGATVVIRDDKGQIYSWGSNMDGQLGDKTTQNRNVPFSTSQVENSELYHKVIKKTMFVNKEMNYNNYLVYATDNEVYIYKYSKTHAA